MGIDILGIDILGIDILITQRYNIHYVVTYESENQCYRLNEPWHEISNNVVCATSKGSDKPAHTRSLIRAFASRVNTL